MISENLLSLRKLNQMTQEDVAEKVGVSRQAVAKWENGETVPDVQKCMLLAELYQVSMDALVGMEPPRQVTAVTPKGKYIFGVVVMGEKGQIIIPQKARSVFNLKPGERLLVLGDENQGIALIREDDMLSMMNAVRQLGQEEAK